MRRAYLLMLLLVAAAAGCSNDRFYGPIQTRHLPRADAPGYTIPEQEARGRQRYSILEDDWRIGPKAYIDRVSPTGR